MDAADPRCPDCDGPVGITAEHCMHCGATFRRPVDAEGDTARSHPAVETTSAPGGGPVPSRGDGRSPDRSSAIDGLRSRLGGTDDIGWRVMLQVSVGSALLLGVFVVPALRLFVPLSLAFVGGVVVALLTTGYLLFRASLAAVRRSVATLLCLIVGSYLLGTALAGPDGATVETLGIYAVGGVLVLSLSYRPEWWIVGHS